MDYSRELVSSCPVQKMAFPCEGGEIYYIRQYKNCKGLTVFNEFLKAIVSRTRVFDPLGGPPF